MRISSLLSDHDADDAQHRACERVPVKLQVRFRSAQDFVVEHATNLSRGGIFIRSDDPPPIDSAVEVQIELPDGGRPPAVTAGVVVHRQLASPGKIAGAGVQFAKESDGFRERIDRYIETLVKD